MHRPRADTERRIAYFSMEIALEAAIPTYCGGLGALAGDTIRSAADLEVPMVAVTLLHRKGYFYQRLDATGWQTEEPVEWSVDDYLEEVPGRVAVTIEGRPVALRAWRYRVRGRTDHTVPIYFLDSDLPENSEWDRTLTNHLYGGDPHYRLCQEVILGIGGIRMLRAQGYTHLDRYHMNEGHSSLLTLELLEERARSAGSTSVTADDLAALREQCVFTTHTPVAAGHDRFPLDLVARVMGRQELMESNPEVFCYDGVLNLTYLALKLSHYVNGVAQKHGEVSRLMFAGYQIDAITNGVHMETWTAPAMQELFDRHIPGWRQDSFSLRYALKIPREEVWEAHMRAKQELLRYANMEANSGLDKDVLTLGFARRATAYKRPGLFYRDPDRLRHLVSSLGPLQVIYAGKAHPGDQQGKELLQFIFQQKEALKSLVRIVYLENYNLQLARLITAGVDIWLNTPLPTYEASGTSGMKAAMNGVPSLSILDGWWIEGCIEGVTGWSIGGEDLQDTTEQRSPRDAQSLFDKLEHIVIPLFYRDRDGFIDVMRHAIALNGSFFNTQRMLQQYVLNAYFL